MLKTTLTFFIIFSLPSVVHSSNSKNSLSGLENLENHYFSIFASPDRQSFALTNSNYNSLDIVNGKDLYDVSIPHINTFSCKWSPDSEKILLTTANYTNKRRKNGLIVISQYGELLLTIIESTFKNIIPIGWTGDNTFHYQVNNILQSFNMNGDEIEWDQPLVYSKNNKLYIKDDPSDPVLIHEADDIILNLSYQLDANLIAFEVYGNEPLIIKNKSLVINDIDDGNMLSISENGKTVVYAKLKDDGYQITEGDLFLFDLKNSTTVKLKNKNGEIRMNPVWITNELIYFIDFRTGSINSLIVKQ